MNVVVGITGGIAAYKTPYLVRMLRDKGYNVQCIVTAHALEFVTRTTLETVSGLSVYSDLFAQHNNKTTEHIALKDWCDAVIVAPATANIIGKMVHGIGDDALSTFLLAAWNKPTWVCPAMNCEMWSNPVVQANVEQLRQQGRFLVGPETGLLACGATGAGRMAEPSTIVEQFERTKAVGYSSLPLEGQRILVTAGPTYERIDPVRFIGNFSTGKMGIAIAEEAAAQGADVALVTGPGVTFSDTPHIHTHKVESALQMMETVSELFDSCHATVMAAAVADYRPSKYAQEKIKRQGNEEMCVQLVQNPDILATLGTRKKEWQTLIGFALETHDEMTYAKEKMQRKNLDYIVMNSLRDAGAGFGTDTNKVTLIDRNGQTESLPLMSKRQVAEAIVKHCLIKGPTDKQQT